jgi:hypothetical protein
VTSADAFIVLPTHSLGKEYYVMSYYSSMVQSYNYPSQFAIVGVEDNTKISISPTANTYKTKNTNTQTITLNQGEVYLVQCAVTTAREDLTGTHILADKNIVVIAGHQRTEIPPNAPSRDCLLAQMLPVSTWGKNAIITPFEPAPGYNSNKDIYRVLASRDNTEIYIDGSLVTTLNKGKYYQANLEYEAVISSNNPIMVATYTKTAAAGNIGDPTIIIVPPVEQYKSSYTLINAPIKERGRNNPPSMFSAQYIGIIAPEEAIDDGLYLDGSPLSKNIFKEIGNTGYFYVNYKSTDGTHNLNTSRYPFCVIAYGYGTAVSYGYLGGMAMKELEDISLVVVPDKCFHTFEVTYTESFHSGIKSVEIVDSINCTLTLKRQTKWKIIWDLTKKDFTQDAIIRIKVTDIYDKDSIYVDTITTDYLLGFVESETIDFGKVTISRVDSSVVNVINLGSLPITLTDKNFKLASNTKFTIAKSIFPITINPNDTAKIKLFYAPTQVNKKTIYDTDTLTITTDCFNAVINLIGEATSDTLRMTGVCNIPLIMIGDTIDISFAPPTITPNPTNSSVVSYKFPVYTDSDVSVKIFDIEGKQTSIFTGFLIEGMYEMPINISDFASGMYLIYLESDGYNHSEKLLIER